MLLLINKKLNYLNYHGGWCLNWRAHIPGRVGGGYSLYSDDRDDRRLFLGVVIGDFVFFRGSSSKIL